MTWLFAIADGAILYPDGVTVARAYAGGNSGTRPDAINNPAMESVKNVGPLPEGWYTMGAAINSQHLGPCAIPLIPDPGNEMYGRGGFFVHGDTAIPGHASNGCPVTDPTTRHIMAGSDDKRVRVVASMAGALKDELPGVAGASAANSQGG